MFCFVFIKDDLHDTNKIAKCFVSVSIHCNTFRNNKDFSFHRNCLVESVVK